MTTETRTVQAIARAQAAATFIEPEHSIMLALCDRIDALEKALNPSAWTKAMSDAWHQNIPDTQRAFYALYRAALSPPSDNSDAQAGSMK